MLIYSNKTLLTKKAEIKFSLWAVAVSDSQVWECIS